jgi:hypothetical protein
MGQRGLRENRGGEGQRSGGCGGREQSGHVQQPRWCAKSDPVPLPQVPVAQMAYFPVCERVRAQTVRILCTFCDYQMLYCADLSTARSSSAPMAGNRLKWHL